MNHNFTGRLTLKALALALMVYASPQARSQTAEAKYPEMAPVEQYLMERNAEIAIARSAAPESISRDAEVLILSRHGYETMVQGKNGFVCIVERSWTSGIEDPGFWNPRVRAPICLNAPAARFYLPRTIKKTELVLAGRTKTQMLADVLAAIDRKELPTPEPGAMCYMMSKQGYLNDSDGHWHPHLMFFAPQTDSAVWGADLPGSPVLRLPGSEERLTIFLVPVRRWSDGTPDLPM